MKMKFTWSKFKSSKTYIIILGLSATLWFLIRVIQKPSRAHYPCMQAAAPLMSSFIIYLLGISGAVFSFRRFKNAMYNSRYLLGSLFLFLAVVSFAFIFLNENRTAVADALNPVDNTFPVASNEPVGVAQGLFPGRVVWVHDPKATNENYAPKSNSVDFWYTDRNADEEVIKKMLSQSIKEYAGTSNISDAWDAIFKAFNKSHGRGEVGYTAGEKIAFKINLTNQGSSDSERPMRMDVAPQLLNAILHELVDNAGVAQSDIIMGDPYREFRHEYDYLVKREFPDVYYVDGNGGQGVHKTVPSEDEVLVFSDKKYKSTLPQQYLDATYLINIPCLKSHNEGGITLIAKNHQGSFLEKGDDPASQYAINMHYCLPANSRGSRKYRHTVDYMGHKDTGGKGLLYIVDGIWGGESWEGWIKKFKSAPFNNDYPNSIFVGQDPVALESVCYDVLFHEYDADGSKQDYPIRYKTEIADYLSQCASSDFWPDDITYDPEGDGTPIESLGVFEHWNNPVSRQYSRNLGTGEGIELKYLKSAHGLTQQDTIFSYLAKTPVTIDGQATEECWANAEWYAIDQVWIPWNATMKAGDFEGRYKVAWNEDYLYVLVEVVDDMLSDDHTNPLQNWWDDDCVEVFIDEDRSMGNHERNNNAFAYHTSLFYDAVDLNSSGQGINYKNNIEVKMDTVDQNTYLWEFAIKNYDASFNINNPEASRVKLEANKKMGFAIAYCDNDETNARENFIGSMVMTQSTSNDMYKNADHFGLMVLIDPDNTTSAERTKQNLYVKIYPVPAMDHLTVQTSSSGAESRVSVISLSGKVVKSESFNGSVHTINMNNLEPGNYVVKITQGNKFYSQTIIKQ